MDNKPLKTDNLREIIYQPLVKPLPQEFEYNSNLHRTTRTLFFVAIAANFAQITMGLMLAWISPVSEQILSIDPNINPFGQPVTILELSLIGAASPTGSIIGPILVGKCYDVFGRKIPLLAICFIMTFSLVLVAYSTKICIFCGLLFIIGSCIGALNIGYPLYISEICEDHNRGKISCLVQAGVPLGTIIGFMVGPYLTVKVFTLVCAIPSALSAICFLTVLPESPIQLVKQKNIAGAVRVIQYLRQKSPKDVEEDVHRIEYELQKTFNGKQGGCSQILSDKSSRNGLIIAGGAYNILVLNGTLALTSYLQPIFDKVGTTIPSNISALSVAFVQILCYIGAFFAVERYGRRKLIFFSTVSSIFPLLSLGCFFHFKHYGYNFVENLDWYPVVALILYNALNNFGNATAPVALMNDLFTNQVKATAITVVVLLFGVLNALMTFGLPIIMESIGVEWCFWIFAGNSVIGSVFVYFLVPETTGKTLLEIQEMLKNIL